MNDQDAGSQIADVQRSVTSLLDSPVFARVMFAVVGVAVIYLVGLAIKRVLTRVIQEDQARYRTRKVVGVVVWIVSSFFVAGTFSNQLGSVAVAIGLTGAGIAVALQDVLVSFAGWLALSVGGVYKTGDRVMLGGVKGDVIDISPLRTTVMECGDWIDGDLYNGRVVRIANSFLFKDPVYNYSGDFPFLWDEIKVPIRYGSDLTEARQLVLGAAESVVGQYGEQAGHTMDQLARKYLIERADVRPTVTMAIDENWATFTLRYVVEYKFRRRTRDGLFTSIMGSIDATDGRVRLATASQEITLVPA